MDEHKFIQVLKEHGLKPLEISLFERTVGIDALKSLLIQAGILRNQSQWSEALSQARSRFLNAVAEERGRGLAWEDVHESLG